MAIVEEYMSGNCKISFDDKYAVKTKEEVNKILKQISEIYSRYFSEHPEDLIE